MRTTLLALALLVACGHGAATTDENGNSLIPTEQEGPPGSFDVECRFDVSRCEAKAADRCGAEGHRVLSTYQSSGAFGSSYWYMKAICGRPQ